MLRNQKACYCAFCKSRQRIYAVKSVGFSHIGLSAMAALTLTYIFTRDLHPAGIVVFVLLLAICELFLKIRWRMAVICRQCGFDPILYMKNVDKAVARVKAHMDRRKGDPNYLLAKPLNLPSITQERAEFIAKARAAVPTSVPAQKEGKLINRQI